jgi:hypothetical protein
MYDEAPRFRPCLRVTPLDPMHPTKSCHVALKKSGRAQGPWAKVTLTEAQIAAHVAEQKAVLAELTAAIAAFTARGWLRN